MNILYLSGCFDMGGTELYTLGLAKGMKESGHNVYWATKTDGLMSSEVVKYEINKINCCLNKRNPMSALKAAKQIREAVVANDIDIVHAVDAYSALILLFAFRKRKKRPYIVWSNVGIGTDSYKLMYKLCGNKFDCILAVSQYIKNRMVEVGFEPESIKVHYGAKRMLMPSVDASEIRALYGIADTDIVIGAVGRLVEMKGNATLIKAMPQILKSVPNAKLVLVGDGPDRERLEQLATSLGIRDKLTVTGFKGDIENYYNAFDIVAFPTYVEALGYIPIESWFYGKPVVASYTGGIPEIVKHEYNGLLVSTGITEEWAGSIISLVNDHTLRTNLVKNGKDYFLAHMTEKHSYDLLKTIYFNLVSKEN